MFKALWGLSLSVATILAASMTSVLAASGNELQASQQKEDRVQIDSVLELSNDMQTEVQATDRQEEFAQVTSVSQLSDVKPTDWAFTALQSLVERYGCIAGYPDRTYRGQRSLSRYEFAAGLNACLDKINEIITAGLADKVSKEDLAAVQKLQEEFAAELATLKGRVDSLEAKTAQLEAQQFSTTTKLRGEAVFIAADTFGNSVNSKSDNTQAFLGSRLRLTLPTSFTGKDLLTIRLAANNIPVLQTSTGTAQTRLTFDKGNFPDNSIYLDQLFYRFPLGEKTTAWVGARQLQPAEFAPNLNTLIGGSNGAASRFATHNPTVYRPGFDGAGVAISHQFSDQLRLGLGYLADDTQAGDPSDGRGLFSSNNLIYSQLAFSPSREFDLALSYGHKYFGTNTKFNLTGGTGSTFARNPFDQNATTSDNFGLQFLWKISPKFQLGGWFGYTLAHQVSGGNSEATILNGALTFAFPDLFTEGNLGGIVIGVPPKVTSNNYRPRPAAATLSDLDTSIHLEAFYTFRLNKNVTITPDIFAILSPENNSNNGTIWVGSIRTTFSF